MDLIPVKFLRRSTDGSDLVPRGRIFSRAIQGRSVAPLVPFYVWDLAPDVPDDQKCPEMMVHGTRYNALPRMYEVGLSCLPEHNPKNQDEGRGCIHSCPCHPEDICIRSEWRPNSQVATFVHILALVAAGAPVSRTTNEVLLIQGMNGSGILPPKYLPHILHTRTNKYCFLQNNRC